MFSVVRTTLAAHGTHWKSSSSNDLLQTPVLMCLKEGQALGDKIFSATVKTGI